MRVNSHPKDPDMANPFPLSPGLGCTLCPHKPQNSSHPKPINIRTWDNSFYCIKKHKWEKMDTPDEIVQSRIPKQHRERFEKQIVIGSTAQKRWP